MVAGTAPASSIMVRALSSISPVVTPGWTKVGQFVEDFSRKPAGLAHALEAVRPVELDRAVAIDGLVAFDYLIFGHAAHIVALGRNCEGPSASR